jgi:nitronate monooxygenase
VIVDTLGIPIVLAPLAGGPSTPELAAAVSNAGGLGFVAAGYLKAADLAARIARVRELTDRPFGVNLFVPGPRSDPSVYADYVRDLGEPRWDDDDWDAKLELLTRDPVDVVSFTFGCPSRDVIGALPGEAWVTVTTPFEARAAVAAGADAVVVQGAEAGGHRGSWVDDKRAEPIGLLALLQLVDVDVPKIASGGIATPQAVNAVRALGAAAAQIGTAFLRAPEAGTVEAFRERLTGDTPTALTRAFTGRLARGIRNRFMDERPDAPIAYPEINYATSAMRAAARKAGDADAFNLWAGQAYPLAQARPAAEIARELGAGPGAFSAGE